MQLPDDVEQDIRRLDELFRSQRTLSTKLEAVADMVQRTVPGCDGASVTLTVEEAMFTGASTSQLAIEADLVQYRVGEGPCVASSEERAAIRIDAVAEDERFEHFAPGAVEAGVESVLSVPLMSDGQAVGSINLYSGVAEGFTDDDPARITDLVAYAVTLITSSSLYEASVATLSRIVEAVQQAGQIEIAVGMLIVLQSLTPAEAWDHLQARAVAEGGSILDQAQALIDAHERGLERAEDDDE